MKPKFIVLEGIDGSGTTTQAHRLVEHLGSARAVFTCEPTGEPIGRMIRTVLSGDHEVDPRTLALLFAADRREHLRAIRESLHAGLTVVCDRYVLSSWAYQSLQNPLAWIKAINEDFIVPDLLILLDLDPAIAEQRRAHRGERPEIFEVPQTQIAVREAYREVILGWPGWPARTAVLDAGGDAGEIHAKICAEVDR